MRTLLISTYELGHQPLGLARPAASLAAAGHAVVGADLAVEPLPWDEVRRAGLIGTSVPMHTATRLGAALLPTIRRLNPAAHVVFYGLYAGLHAQDLLAAGADSVIGGEVDLPLAALAGWLESGSGKPPPGVTTRDGASGPSFARAPSFLPRRDLLPPLERYARFHDGTDTHLAGYVEASRGCAHRCRHCPITPVYAGRMRVAEADVVLGDVDQLVELGARHITFGDPDFFNGIKHSLGIVQALHARHPQLTYDATIKVEHLLEHRAALPLLKQTGCAFVVSAVESLQDDVLRTLRKGHTAADVATALDVCTAAGLTLRPTLVPFTPWTTLDGYRNLLRFVERRALIRHVDTVQWAIRLLLPRGSSLLEVPALAPHLGPFEAATFSYQWTHPDPRVDALQAALSTVVEQAIREKVDVVDAFDHIVRLADAAAGMPPRLEPRPPVPEHVPRLTEAWFC